MFHGFLNAGKVSDKMGISGQKLDVESTRWFSNQKQLRLMFWPVGTPF